MPNLDNSMGQVAEIVISEGDGQVRFKSLDMMYLYRQTELHPDTTGHCNFQNLGGRITGTYAINTASYGLTIMPPVFQKNRGENTTQHSRSSTVFSLLQKELKISR